MKKLILILAVLVAAPAFALTVELVDNGSGSVTVHYSDANSANLPRAFGLDIQVDAPAVITAVGSVSTDYNIFPGSIVIDGNTGDVTNPGTPLAVAGDPGAGTGLGTGHIVLEMGSLYEDGVDTPPATSGDLCTLTIDCNGGSDVNVVMVDEDAYRGGLVLEDGTQGDVSDSIVICSGPVDCMPGTTGDYYYDQWVSVGKPDCWCSSNQPRQCRGDADGVPEGKGNYWVFLNDLTILKAAWQKNFATIDGQTAGDPGTAVAELICADFDHEPEGKGAYRVFLNDLAILKANWQVGNGPAGDCNTLGF